ncbi:hypothetical protein E4099_29845 [Streptomyces palmae]|uniref:Gram-positive cocci surface proteins LPxTG domain-containing protein n=1 Tax=Streptomyces palmae TaxID=1701085 RepID=A0A4Z0FYD4_9ACTN|nr:hypothetical protein E4099_29845 [Streptomyces palmae]
MVLLADRSRRLRPHDIRFEFYDERGAQWRPVRFRSTPGGENAGVFTGRRFAGFTVPAHGDLTVALRSRFAADGPLGPVTATVSAGRPSGADATGAGWSGQVTFRITDHPARRPGAAPSTGGGGPERPPGALAETGRAVRISRQVLLPLAGAAAVLLTGGGLLLYARRTRRR